MLDGIIKSKNILPSILLAGFVMGWLQYDNQISWFQLGSISVVYLLMLFYTKVNSLTKSVFVVNTIFLSSLVLLGVNDLNNSILWSCNLVIIAFFFGRYFYKLKDRFVFIDVSLFIFLAIILYPPAIFFVLFIYFLMLFHSVKKISAWLLPLFCFMMYIGVFLGVSFLLDFDVIHYLEKQRSYFELAYYSFSIRQLFLLISLVVFVVFALIDHYQATFKQSIYNKRHYELIVYFLLISGLLFIVSIDALLFILFPCSVIIGKYIYYQKNKKLKWIMILYFPVSALIWSVL